MIFTETFLSSLVLVGAEGSFTGHLALFASLSKFLKEIFLSTPVLEENTVLILPEVDYQELSQLVSFLYGRKKEMKSSSDIFRRLGLTGIPEPKQQLQCPDVSDHNSNVNPDIEAAEVLIDNDNVLSSSLHLQTLPRVETPHPADCPLFCILCNNGFSSQAGLREHLQSHPICVLCGHQFLRNSDLLEHWKQHPQCGVCGDRLLSQAELEQHELGHDNFEDSLSLPALITNNTNLGKPPSLDSQSVVVLDNLMIYSR